MLFCKHADFTFIVEYLAHYDLILDDCNIDYLYDDILTEFLSFKNSKFYYQDTSYLQAIKNYLNRSI